MSVSGFRGVAHNTWFAKQTWFSEGAPFFRSILFFSRHSFRPEDIFSRDEMYGTVALKITGGEPTFGAKFDFHNFSDKDIRFRELFHLSDETYKCALLTSSEANDLNSKETWSCEPVNSNGDVIESLIGDVFQRKLGI